MRRASPTPLTEIIVRLCSKMDPEQRLWFLNYANEQEWDPETIKCEAEKRVGIWGQYPKPKAQKLWSWGKDKNKRHSSERTQSSTRQREPEPHPQGTWRDFPQRDQRDADDEFKKPSHYTSQETREYYNQRPVDAERCQDDCSRRFRDDPANSLQLKGLCVLPCCLEHRHDGDHLCRTCADDKTRAEGDEDMELNPNEPVRWPQQQGPEPYVSPTRRPYQSEQVPPQSPLEPNRPRRTYPARGEGEDEDRRWKHRVLT